MAWNKCGSNDGAGVKKKGGKIEDWNKKVENKLEIHKIYGKKRNIW